MGRRTGESEAISCLDYSTLHSAPEETSHLSVMEQTIAKLEGLLSTLEGSGQNVAKVKH